MPGSAVLDSSALASIVVPLDAARGAIAALGVRTFRVYREVTVWDGGERGVGNPTTTQTEILPIPEVVDARGRQLEPAGLSKVGKIRLREVSHTYLLSELDTKAPDAATAIVYRLVDLHGQGAPDAPFAITDGCAAPRADWDDTFGWVVELAPVEFPA